MKINEYYINNKNKNKNKIILENINCLNKENSKVEINLDNLITELNDLLDSWFIKKYFIKYFIKN